MHVAVFSNTVKDPGQKVVGKKRWQTRAREADKNRGKRARNLQQRPKWKILWTGLSKKTAKQEQSSEIRERRKRHRMRTRKDCLLQLRIEKGQKLARIWSCQPLIQTCRSLLHKKADNLISFWAELNQFIQASRNSLFTCHKCLVKEIPVWGN